MLQTQIEEIVVCFLLRSNRISVESVLQRFFLYSNKETEKPAQPAGRVGITGGHGETNVS